MALNHVLKAVSFVVVVMLVALLAWLTTSPEPDACVDPQTNISAAALADQDTDQEALVNRAIILRGPCDSP